MLALERRAVGSIAMIMACRMLGMFMILPVFALYAGSLAGATPELIGLALGIYGFTQAILQLPFGFLSDRFGRKPIITLGLCIFAFGSLVAALSHSIGGIIIGRALQGGGAIGSTLLALVADLTRDENRSKAMALMGMAIGVSFSIALIIGPAINAYFHLNGIFWVTFGFALFSILLLYTTVPNPPAALVDPAVEARLAQFGPILKNPQLLRLDFGIFTMHAILTATFIAIPHVLAQTLNISEHAQTVLYLVVLVLAFFTMFPFIIIAEKKRRLKIIFLSAIGLLTLTELFLWLTQHNIWLVGSGLFLFFTAFSLLEASLPSLVSKIAPIQRKGTAMGIYSTAQFMGIFIGGSLGGVLLGHFGVDGVFLLCLILGLAWLLIACTMQEPPYLSTVIIKINNTAIIAAIQSRLEQQHGVSEVAYMASEQLLYVKIDKKIISEDELRNLIKQSSL